MRFGSLGGAMAGRQKTLEQEIRTLVLIIETNQAAMRLATKSKADKAQLLRALDERKARLALLQEQLAAHPRSK